MNRARHCRVLGFCAAAALALGACSKPAPPPATENQPSVKAPAVTPPTPATAASPQEKADADALGTLEARIKEYLVLHQKLEDSLPKLSKESTPIEIDKHQRALGRLVREARRGAQAGDIFTPESTVVIKRLMARIFGGPDGRQLRASIMDENPGDLKLEINGRYPDTVPLSTVPPQVLQGLPKVPEELEYRFIGNRLILLDVRAHVIVDIIEKALPD